MKKVFVVAAIISLVAAVGSIMLKEMGVKLLPSGMEVFLFLFAGAVITIILIFGQSEPKKMGYRRSRPVTIAGDIGTMYDPTTGRSAPRAITDRDIPKTEFMGYEGLLK